MAKANNEVARKLQNILYDYEYLLSEVETTLKPYGLKKKEIAEFIQDTGVQSEIEQVQDDFEHANSLHESVVQDTYSLRYIEDRQGAFEHKKTNVYDQLAQKVSELDQARQKQ